MPRQASIARDVRLRPGEEARPALAMVLVLVIEEEQDLVIRTMGIALETEGHAQVVNITESVAEAVRKSGVLSGIVTVFCPSATSGVTTIEHEDGVVQDFKRLFDEMVAPNREYLHNVLWGW